MEEKTKRKEKPKRSHRRFLGVSILLTTVLLLGLVWVFSYITRPIPISPAFFETSTVIILTNQWALTQISASATQSAIATNQHEATRGYLQETATPSRATATAEDSP